MFRVTFMVDDKHLAGVLHAVAVHKVMNLENTPITNTVKTKNGKVEAASGGSSADLLLSHLTQNHLTEITSKDVHAFMEANGMTAKTSFNAIYSLIQRKVLKRTSVKGKYKVIGG